MIAGSAKHVRVVAEVGLDPAFTGASPTKTSAGIERRLRRQVRDRRHAVHVARKHDLHKLGENLLSNFSDPLMPRPIKKTLLFDVHEINWIIYRSVDI